MATEIERKFLDQSAAWKGLAPAVAFCQGYLSTAPGRTVRVRIAGDRAFVTIKGPAVELARAEFEYEVPVADARQMLDTLCERPLIEKTRTRIALGSHTWEVDEFGGENAGLVIAEIELRSADERFERPAWLGAEVTGDPRYNNSALVANPFCLWRR